MVKRKRSEDIENTDIFSFDCVLSFEKVENYISKIKDYQVDINNIITKKREDNLKDTDKEIKEISDKIKDLQHNIRYNLFHFNKINNILTNINSELKTNLEELCDHDIYSECQYHNDRYYYCKKCTYER